MKKTIITLALAVCAAAALCTAAWGMTLFAELPSGTTIGLEVESGDSIDNIKAKIWDKASIPTDKQYLYYGEKFLNNGIIFKKRAPCWWLPKKKAHPTG